MSYIIFFEFDNKRYRLPVNPEEIKETYSQAVDKYEILKLGQIAVPTHMELREFSFDVELPQKKYHYIEKKNEFISAYSFLKILNEIRINLHPIRFIFGPDINKDGKVDAIGDSVMVLIEDIDIVEKAGEEGDKYVSFSLLEYREFGKKYAVELNGTKITNKKSEGKETNNPNSNGYHIVQKGESLWSIAKKYYGNGAKCNILYHANKDKIKNPNLIVVGWKLKVPDKGEFSKYNSPLPKTVKKEPELIKYTLPGEEIVAGFGAGW